LILGSAGASRAGRRLHLRTAGVGQDLGAADEQARIDAQCPANETERHDRADAQSAAADRNAEATTAVTLRASIFHVAAFREIVQAHVCLLAPQPSHGRRSGCLSFTTAPITRLREYSSRTNLSQ